MQRPGWVGAAVIALVAIAGPAAAQSRPSALTPPMPKRLRIALVPLDDRPVCLQYPEMLAGLAHAEVIAPPVAMLGRFTTPGDTAAIARWLLGQDWRTFDALIVSTDMLAYGGLVASRVHAVEVEAALARLGVLEAIRKAHPSLPIHGFSVIMRLAPTADGANEAWREQLARYAELAHGANTPAEAEELAGLARQIPAGARQDYSEARTRNRRVNLAAVDLAARKVFDYLVVSQDDAKPRGMHLADRAAVTDAVRNRGVATRVGIQPGADEVAMLLLARAVLERRGFAPTVRAIYSTERARTMVAPYEDRQLHETASFQITAAGASELRDNTTARSDLDLYVFASRHDVGVPATFASRIVSDVQRGAPAIVADVDPKGDVQGASPVFTEALLAARVFPSLYGYASWNTAGNTLGTAIPHGLLAWAGARLTTQCTSPAFTALADARATFLLHRLVNDYAWQGVRRPVVNAELRQAGRTAAWVDDHAADLGEALQSALAPRLSEFVRQFSPAYVPPSPGVTDVAVQVGEPRDLDVQLPWGRTFEAAITFDVPVFGLSGPARRLPVCAPPK
jgi:hypothetical protein